MQKFTSISISNRPKPYREVGRCIYCRRKLTKLTKEHVIPYGLAADSLVLPKSSCIKCAEITGGLEQFCLRDMWWPLRTRLMMPSRAKERPTELQLKLIRNAKLSSNDWLEFERGEIASLPPDDYPLFFYFLLLEPPGILFNLPPSGPFRYRTECLVEKGGLMSFGPGNGMRLGPMNETTYLRFLAKISHGYAVAEIGFDAAEWFLPQFIRGRSNANPLYFIGGSGILPPKTPELHSIGVFIHPMRESKFLVLVGLRLFCFLGGPAYTIAVGELKKAPQNSDFSEMRFDAVNLAEPIQIPNLIPIGDAAWRTWE